MTAPVAASGTGPLPDTGALPAVRLSGLSKNFGPVQAVRDLSLTIGHGEVVAFLGPNGAGKTTTIDMILGLSVPSGGDVSVFGMHPQQAIRRGLVSAVLQTGGLLRDFTVAETVRYTASLFGSGADPAAALARAGLTGISDRLVGKCSGGEQQRLRFAMALIPDPQLLILDEPTTGMDVEGRRDFWHAIRQDASEGRTVLFATHYLEEADAYADRVVLIRKGEIVADGTSAQVRSLASGRVVRATLAGASETVLRAVPGVASVEIRGDSVLIRATDADAVARYLLTETAAHDLEITSHGLEEAFLALTGDGEHPGGDQ